MPFPLPWLLAVALLPPPASSAVVERILAVVDGRPLLLSEVRFLARFRGVDEAVAREGLIEEILMLREAARLPQASVSAAEEQRAYDSLRSRVKTLTPAEDASLRRVARRQTAILKYVEFRFRPRVRVSDDAVRQAYAGKYGSDGPPFEAVEAELRRQLADEELGRMIDAWVKELRTSAEIRYPSSAVP